MVYHTLTTVTLCLVRTLYHVLLLVRCFRVPQLRCRHIPAVHRPLSTITANPGKTRFVSKALSRIRMSKLGMVDLEALKGG